MSPQRYREIFYPATATSEVAEQVVCAPNIAGLVAKREARLLALARSMRLRESWDLTKLAREETGS